MLTTLHANFGSPVSQSLRQQLFAQAGTAGMNNTFLAITIGTFVVLCVAFALPARSRAGSLEQTEHIPSIGEEVSVVE